MVMVTCKWFWLFFAVYLIVYFSNKAGYVFPALIQYHLNDLLAVPIVATLSMWLMRFALGRKNYILSCWQVCFIVLSFSISFELIFPVFIKRNTGDPWDVVMYLIGGVFFWKMMNK